MLLTIVLTLDVEKPVEYDRQFFKAMEWSAGEALDEVEVVVLSQRGRPESFPVHLSRCPRNSEDYPVWDLFADVRDVWDRIRGEYVTFSHTEYCWGPDRLRRTLEALRCERPVLALGNLRRTHPVTNGYASRGVDSPLSRLLLHWLSANQFSHVAEWWDCFNGFYWLTQQATGRNTWLEDVFFAKREWFEGLRFFERGGRQPFQDVYDIMGTAMQLLTRHHVAPQVIRFDREVCELVHLAHDKCWSAYTPAMRDWFFAHREEWAETTFIRDDLWRRVLNSAFPGGVVRDFRRAPGGTVTNWHSEFSGWLQNGGASTAAELCR